MLALIIGSFLWFYDHVGVSGVRLLERRGLKQPLPAPSGVQGWRRRRLVFPPSAHLQPGRAGGGRHLLRLDAHTLGSPLWKGMLAAASSEGMRGPYRRKRVHIRADSRLVSAISWCGRTRPFRRRPDSRAELCTDTVHRSVKDSIIASLTLPVGYLQCCISIYFHLTWTGDYLWNGERLTFTYLIGATSIQLNPTCYSSRCCSLLRCTGVVQRCAH